MPGCATCRHRKVKCDGRAGKCMRCEKLGITCQWTAVAVVQTDETGAQNVDEQQEPLTQAGYKRLRTSVACEPCRKRKAKCDALRPNCGTCLRLGSRCSYDREGESERERGGELSESTSPERRAHGRLSPNTLYQEETPQGFGSVLAHSSPVSGFSSQPPSGSDLLPYIDAFLQNVHSVGCNNCLHPGVLGEALGKAPRLLVLALCGLTAKFTKASHAPEQGRLWIEAARKIVLEDMNSVSTLNISVLQFLATHDMQEGRFTSASNLTAMAARMALQLGLNRPGPRQPSEMTSAQFLRAECHNRLMWSVFVSDLLYTFDESHIGDQMMNELSLPCNLWSFTQGAPCTTLRLPQVSDPKADSSLRQATNPCAYLIKIIAIRRRIQKFVSHYRDSDGDSTWSDMHRLHAELEDWRRCLPTNFAFEERNMFTFRASCHLDIFFMIHIWYHQSGCELFGAWMPGHAGSIPFHETPPRQFLQRCQEGALAHARGITQVIQKILKMEPDHLFRDAWFGLCVLDSTRIQIAGLGLRYAQGGDDLERGVSSNLKVHLQALKNTKETIPLAAKIYEEVCASMRRAGLQEAVGLDIYQIENEEPLPSQSSMEIFRRYPFLEPTRYPNLSGWDELFNATNFGQSVAATRDVSPVQNESTERFIASVPDTPFGLPDQVFTPWPLDDFQWQTPGVTPNTVRMDNAHALDDSSTLGVDHHLFDFSSADSFIPVQRT